MKKRLAFLVSHGTDTMSWALAYLTYSLKDCAVPVALVGSQLPMTERFSGSDGFNNINLAVNTLLEVREGRCLCAFDNGRRLFTRNLWKKDKWDSDAFAGTIGGISNSNDFIYLQGIRRHRETLDTLCVVRAGGTIDAEMNDANYLSHAQAASARKSIVWEYVDHEFRKSKKWVREVEYLPVFNGDSSDCTHAQWAEMTEGIASRCRKEGYLAQADDKFEPDVRVIPCTPFTSSAGYEEAMRGARGVILLGYGAGNTNIQDKGHSPIPALKSLAESGGIAVLCSWAHEGIVDSVYENGAALFDQGLALPGLDYSVASAQVKLGFILGHNDDLNTVVENLARAQGTDPRGVRKRLIATLFLSGGRFTNEESRKRLLAPLAIDSPRHDLLANRPFAEALVQAGIQIRRPLQDTRLEVRTEEELSKARAFSDGACAIVKPDPIVGTNRIGEPLDAGGGLANFLATAYEWPVVTLELAQLCSKPRSQKIQALLESCRLHLWEGGRPSIYDPASFTTPKRETFMGLLGATLDHRSASVCTPGNIYICLSHQGVAQTLFDKVMSYTSPVALRRTAVGQSIQALCGERDRWKLELNLPDHIVRSGAPEAGISRLVPFRGVGIPALDETHSRLASRFSGLLEDLLAGESLDIGMAHGDFVDPKGLLFANWFLVRLNEIRQAAQAREASLIPSMPVGIEVTSSSANLGGEVVTEVASTAIYYTDAEGHCYHDLSFQFHPELVGLESLRTPLPGEELRLDPRNDGVKLLISAISSVQRRFCR